MFVELHSVGLQSTGRQHANVLARPCTDIILFIIMTFTLIIHSACPCYPQLTSCSRYTGVTGQYSWYIHGHSNQSRLVQFLADTS